MEVSSMLSGVLGRPYSHDSPKQVSFELLLDDDGSRTRARLPLRKMILPHETTESMVMNVKDFFGIYEGHGVRFQDVNGNIFAPSYDNVVEDMQIHVRAVPGTAQSILSAPIYQHMTAISDPQRRVSLGDPFQMLPPHISEQARSPSRPNSRLARKRSVSPQLGRGRRSSSRQQGGSVSAASRGSSASGTHQDDAMNGYSDSEAGRSSIAGSRKARSEQYASAEISSENILQDGRRGKGLFESSELPLFVPPQVPITTSTSSISPQRRSLGQEGPSPLYPANGLYAYQPHPMMSPQSYNPNAYYQRLPELYNTSLSTSSQPQHGHQLRDRSGMRTQDLNGRAGYSGHRVLPTPDPTVASCISDEDVARQLIALGDASNFSHGRTSASTLDDAFSGAADAASSTGATSDSENDSDGHVATARQKRPLFEENDGEYGHDGHIKKEYNDYEQPRTKKIKTKNFDGSVNSYRSSKSSSKADKGKVRGNMLSKASKSQGYIGLMKAPTVPDVPDAIRKTSSSSTLDLPDGSRGDEEDLSSKPRCQRCRKSKKGCDRQRPCQRCKDAGIGIEGCISEDEGNGRKGRYGRHMGVSVAIKNGDTPTIEDDDSQAAGEILTGMADGDAMEKNKKRKR